MVINTEINKTLQAGKITIQGEFLWGSNYTFLVEVVEKGTRLKGVYKPSKGEQPLWDFPSESLANREVAAYLVSEALGWEFVPPTVLREDAPLGRGSIQLYIDHDPEYHYFNFNQVDRQRLRPVVLFDLLINNADRKGSHILKDPNGSLWLIDHGVCFHVEEKLRTVIWDFMGEAIPENLCADLTRLNTALNTAAGETSKLEKALQLHLNRKEIRALSNRAAKLVSHGHFPQPSPDRRPYPWPQI